MSGLQAQGKGTIYLVTEIDVTNPEAYGKEFAPKAQASIKNAAASKLQSAALGALALKA